MLPPRAACVHPALVIATDTGHVAKALRSMNGKHGPVTPGQRPYDFLIITLRCLGVIKTIKRQGPPAAANYYPPIIYKPPAFSSAISLYNYPDLGAKDFYLIYAIT